MIIFMRNGNVKPFIWYKFDSIWLIILTNYGTILYSMPLRKRQHPKYLKKKTDKEKKSLKAIINATKKKQILRELYHLPLDVKIKIYAYAVREHMVQWSMNHQKHLKQSLLILDPEYFETDASNYLEPSVHDFLWKKKILPLCHRKVKESGQPGIQDVLLSDVPDHSVIRYRQWTNKEGYYWYHRKCRCKKCDMIRYHGLKDLSQSEKVKYARIDWNHFTDRWYPKTKSLVKYEKDIERSLIRKVRKVSLNQEFDRIFIWSAF